MIDLEKYAGVLQGTPEWDAARLGKATASRMADLSATVKGGWGASRKNYCTELVLERITGRKEEGGFKSYQMERGNEIEAEARAAYAFQIGESVSQIAFVDHPAVAMSGASPDGLVGGKGLLELKCPIAATHFETLQSGKIPAVYQKQMLWALACTGREWVDYVSYDPRFPVDLQLYVQRIPRDGGAIVELEGMVREFLREVDAGVAALRALRSRDAA